MTCSGGCGSKKEEKHEIPRKPSPCCACDCHEKKPCPDPCESRYKPVVDPFARDGPWPSNKKCPPILPKPVKCVPCAVEFACPFKKAECPVVAPKPIKRVPCEVKCWMRPCISAKPKEIPKFCPPKVSCCVSAICPFPSNCKLPEIQPICPKKVGCAVPCTKPWPGNCKLPEIEPICPPCVSCPVPASPPCKPCTPVRGCSIVPKTVSRCCASRTVEAASSVSRLPAGCGGCGAAARKPGCC